MIDLSTGGLIYLDANAIIYSVEKIEPYHTLLQVIWLAAKAGSWTVVTSELTLLETLVKPLRESDALLGQIYHALLTAAQEVQLVYIDRTVLEEAAKHRAIYGLKTPDAIHAASAGNCVFFVTNDPAFRRVAGLPVAVLKELSP
jgi:predicted nucleic acid-binding protein